MPISERRSRHQHPASNRVSGPIGERGMPGHPEAGMHNAGTGNLEPPSGAALLVSALKAHGVRVLFGMPGLYGLPIYDLLAGQADLLPVVHHHEQAAAFAADGFAKVSGASGICISEPDPGAMNLLAGLGASFQDGSPVVVLTLTRAGQPSTTRALKLSTMFRPATKKAFRISAVAEIYPVLGEAIQAARGGRPGPVQVLLPGHLLSRREKKPVEIEPARKAKPRLASDLKRGLDELVGLVRRASNPMIIAGSGLLYANAQQEIRQLAVRLSAPVFTSALARGVVPESDPLGFGMFHFEGGLDIVQSSDLCLVIGMPDSLPSIPDWVSELVKNGVWIDVERPKNTTGFPLRLVVSGDIKLILSYLLEALGNGRPKTYLATLAKKFKKRHDQNIRRFMADPCRMPLHPKWLARTLRENTPTETIFTSDGSATQWWLFEEYFNLDQERTLIIPEIYHTTGYALAAAIGAKLAAPHCPVVCISGDGSFMGMLGEIATATSLGLAITVVIFKDNYLNAERHFQTEFFGGRHSSVELNNPDFVAVARALGGRGFRITRPEQFPEILREAISHKGLTIIEAPIDPEPRAVRFTASLPRYRTLFSG